MTPGPLAGIDGHLLTRPFPTPGSLVQHAYWELELAATGTPEERAPLGDLRRLPRPWDPPTCLGPELRIELWEWLEEVVDWLISEYSWDVDGVIPPCWPRHPHLVHEIAGLADQRRTAGLTLTGDRLEEWHRSTLPTFLDRMRLRLRSHCGESHDAWPARSRHLRHTAAPATDDRARLYGDDAAATPPDDRTGPRVVTVDAATGERI